MVVNEADEDVAGGQRVEVGRVDAGHVGGDDGAGEEADVLEGVGHGAFAAEDAGAGAVGGKNVSLVCGCALCGLSDFGHDCVVLQLGLERASWTGVQGSG